MVTIDSSVVILILTHIVIIISFQLGGYITGQTTKPL